MKEAFITYSEVICPLGDNLKEVFEHVRHKRSGIKKVDSGIYSAAFNHVEQERLFNHRFSAKNPAASSMVMFLLENLLNKQIVDLGDSKTLLILCSTKGDIEQLPQYSSSPLMSLVSSVVTKYSPANLPVLISNACISGLNGLIHAQRLISNDYYNQVLIVGVDSASDFVMQGFSSLSAVSNDICRPFDKNRGGLNLGEGAAITLLKDKPDGLYPVQLVHGCITNDANHITGPSRDGSGLYSAIKGVMDYTQIVPDVNTTFISPHGTGTLYNDEMESLAFSKANISAIPMVAYKGYFGHTLATSGLLETIVGIETLRTGVLPVSYGYSEPGTSMPVNMLKMTDSISENNLFKHFIKTGSGFGGCNATLIISN